VRLQWIKLCGPPEKCTGCTLTVCCTHLFYLILYRKSWLWNAWNSHTNCEMGFIGWNYVGGWVNGAIVDYAFEQSITVSRVYVRYRNSVLFQNRIQGSRKNKTQLNTAFQNLSNYTVVTAHTRNHVGELSRR
jgi:hypothetical protein